ncbi:MAG TPA: hypothetical protein VJK30_06610 [Coxiellaceae bacterium]|nr:MAG: hypothetical protein A3E81_05605 [Gammaproteobacteria bacterium RIFCSPHIGHO2_12_FULL_36_30]HLB56980.1 hypothetical protein [Coxiellaceae bacterium]
MPTRRTIESANRRFAQGKGMTGAEFQPLHAKKNGTYGGKKYNLTSEEITGEKPLCISALTYNCLQLQFTYQEQRNNLTEAVQNFLLFNLARMITYNPAAAIDRKTGDTSLALTVSLEAQASTMRQCMNEPTLLNLVNNLVGLIFSGQDQEEVIKVGCSYISPTYVHNMRLTLNTDPISIEACNALTASIQSEFIKCTRQFSNAVANLLGLIALTALIVIPIYYAYEKLRKHYPNMPDMFGVCGKAVEDCCRLFTRRPAHRGAQNINSSSPYP